MEELVKKAKNNDANAFDQLIILIEKELYLISKTRLKTKMILQMLCKKQY